LGKYLLYLWVCFCLDRRENYEKRETFCHFATFFLQWIVLCMHFFHNNKVDLQYFCKLLCLPGCYSPVRFIQYRRDYMIICKGIKDLFTAHLWNFFWGDWLSDMLLAEIIICFRWFDKVKQHHLSTVAIPAISSGLFNYPRPECANTIVSSVKGYYEYVQHGHSPKEILLVNNDEPTVKEMEKAFYRIFALSTMMTYSQATAKNTRSATKPSPTIQIGNVRVTLRKDKIEEQQVRMRTCKKIDLLLLGASNAVTISFVFIRSVFLVLLQTDVIVNTASQKKNLSEGQISSAISTKAGHGMQKEMCSAKPKGHIITTKAYNLKCKEVYHTLCFGKDQHAAHQVSTSL